MGAGQDGQPDDVDVLLEGGRHDHLGRLAQAGVDDFEAFVAQAAGEHLGAAIVAVEAGLGDENLERSIGHARMIAAAAGWLRPPADRATKGPGWNQSLAGTAPVLCRLPAAGSDPRRGSLQVGHELVARLLGGAEGAQDAARDHRRAALLDAAHGQAEVLRLYDHADAVAG